MRFGFRCPKHLHRIRDLSLLPHLLHTNRCWMDLHFSEVASLFEMEENDFEVCLHQPCLVNKWNGPNRIEHPIGSSIIDFRVSNNGSLPTRMRSLFSWNLNSWRTFDSNEYKLRRCKRLLRKGPVSGNKLLKLSISINRFRVFVSVILPRFVAVSVPEQAGSQFCCHQDGK